MNKVKYEFRSNEHHYIEEKVRKNQMALTSLKSQLEWVKRQIEYITFQDEYNYQFELNAGEIYEFDFGVNVNCEFSNRHYGVVLVTSLKNNPLVLVCPLKTNKYGANPNSDINLGYISGLLTNKETLAVINQIRSLDKMRMYIRPIITEQINKNEQIKLTALQLKKLKEGIIRYFS